MKTHFILAIIFLCAYQISPAQLKIDKNHFISLFQQRNYSQAYKELVDIQTRPLGKCCLTDYLIGKSLCLSGYPGPAKSRYENILTNYKQLPPEIKNLIQQEKKNCESNTQGLTEQTSNNIRVFPPQPPAGVVGKLGMVYNCFQSYEVVHVIHPISAEELGARLFPVSQAADAVKKIQSIIPAGYSVFSKDNFILVTTKGQDNTVESENVVNELVKTLHFYSSFYGLRLPDKLITAYIVPDNESLQDIASAIHGITVPKENYGYSLLSDLSILGISNFIGTGTLKHELFHMVVRGDIGDIPAWLDEGIATIYEESRWEDNDTILISSPPFWRTAVLKKSLTGFQLYSKMPDLKTLVNYSWAEFEGAEKGDICKASVNYAFAKHFVLYLKETNQLKKILEAYKNKRSGNKEDLIKTNAEILVQACAVSIDSTERLFNRWLIKNYQLSFLDPLSNRVNGEEYEGMSALVEFNKDQSKEKIIYDSLLTIKASADSMLFNIDQSKSLFENAANKFDTEMIGLYAKTHGHIDDSKLADAVSQFINSIRHINMDAEKILERYNKRQ